MVKCSKIETLMDIRIDFINDLTYLLHFFLFQKMLRLEKNGTAQKLDIQQFLAN